MLATATRGFSCRAFSLRRSRWRRRRLSSLIFSAGTIDKDTLLEGTHPSVSEALTSLLGKKDELLLISRPGSDENFIASRHQIKKVSREQLSHQRGGFLTVLDAGLFESKGLVMDMKRYRWDVLGQVEEVLKAIGFYLSLLRNGGRLLVILCGEPQDFLLSFFTAFGVQVVGSGGPGLVEFLVHELVRQLCIEAVLEREVFSERSHSRYAVAVRSLLEPLSRDSSASSLHLLDIGGGDGHMAEWWADMGYTVSLLEVDEKSASAASVRLGPDKVILHDGVSAWPYADKSFDVCLLLFVLHHISTESAVRQTLSEANRVSRRKVLVLEDQPRLAASQGLCRLAVAVTAEHFRPFGQDPAQYMQNIRPVASWKSLFNSEGFSVSQALAIPGTLQHPVPHVLYELIPMS